METDTFSNNRIKILVGVGATLLTLYIFVLSPSLSSHPVEAVESSLTEFTYGGNVRVVREATGLKREWFDLGDAVIDLGSGETYFKHFDQRGNVKFITNENGQVVTIYNYHAYGVEKVLGDTSLDPNRFASGFSTGDGLDDLIVLGERVYDPSIGRFISEDPVYNPINQYAYTNGNPIDFWDPSGAETGSSAGGSGFDFGAAGDIGDYGPAPPGWDPSQVGDNDFGASGLPSAIDGAGLNAAGVPSLGSFASPELTVSIAYRVKDDWMGKIVQSLNQDMPGGPPIMHPPGIDNMEASHEIIVFDDGSSIDYTKEHGVQFRQFETEGYRVRMVRTGLNASRVKQAALNVKTTGKYTKSAYNKFINNCHNFVADVLAEYDRLSGQ